MKVRKQSVLAMALGLAFALATGPIAGAESRGDAMTEWSVLGGQVEWSAIVGADGFVLSVSGPDTDFVEHFVGSAPVFSLFDADGNALGDGDYNWELREELAPVNDGVRDPQNGRDTEAHQSDRRIEFTGRVQVGMFTIKNGAVADSDRVEYMLEDGTRIESSDIED